MCLDRDPRVPQSLTEEQELEVKTDSLLVRLMRQKTNLREELILAHGSIKMSAGSPAHAEFSSISKQHDNLEKTLLAEKFEEIRDAFFENIDTIEIQKQLCSDPGHEPVVEGELFSPIMPVHAFPERTDLAATLFGELKLEDSDGAASRDRRCSAIKAMAALTLREICCETIYRAIVHAAGTPAESRSI